MKLLSDLTGYLQLPVSSVAWWQMHSGTKSKKKRGGGVVAGGVLPVMAESLARVRPLEPADHRLVPRPRLLILS